MIVQDKLEKERIDAKNAVEEYLYDLRNKLCGVYEKYITQEVMAACGSLTQCFGFLKTLKILT